MAFNPIAAAIPVFFVAIGLEAAWAWARGREVYRVNDAIADLSCGITSQIAGVFSKAATAAGYIGLYQTARLFDLPDTHWATWVFAFMFTDFAYYLWHRFTHEVNVGWATHVVHHQSEDYNLAVALRQSITSSWSSWPFYLPMALLGVSPFVAFTCGALNTLYQFWIHTELIDRMGPLEWVMNTPSHHRVHHGVNPQYLDKNYAGVFIVWDRLLGTFEPEDEAPVYGTVKPLDSFNPVWANVWWIDRLLRQSSVATGFDRVALWVRGPGFRPAGVAPDPVAPSGKYDAQGVPGVPLYVLVHFVPVAVLTTWVLWVSLDRTPLSLIAPCTLIGMATLVWGGLFERRAWAVPLEIVRLAAFAAWMLALSPMAGALMGLVALASAVWLALAHLGQSAPTHHSARSTTAG